MATSVTGVLERVCSLSDSDLNTASDLKAELKRAFSHTNLSQCFVKTTAGKGRHDIDIDSVRKTLSPLMKRPQLTREIAEIIRDEHASQDLGSRLIESGSSDLLRVIPILLECPAYEMPGDHYGLTIIQHMASTLIKLKNQGEDQLKLLVRWWSDDPELFERAVMIFLKAFDIKHAKNDYILLSSTDHLLQILTTLHQVNEKSGHIIPTDRFYLKDIEKHGVLDRHIQIHIDNMNNNSSKRHCLVDMAFLLPLPAKWKVLQTEVTVRQQMKQNSLAKMVIAPTPMGLIPVILRHIAHFEVDRNDLIKSALDNAKKAPHPTLPLEIQFKYDTSLGVNAGGPMKEFFTLLFKRLLDADEDPLFKKLEESTTCTTYWFNQEYADEDSLRSVGKLFGLMLYNKVVVSLPFPNLFYKKLLTDSDSCFEELKLLDPDMAKSMETLLEMTNEKLSDLDFTFTMDDSKGNSVELKSGGAAIAVNKENVGEYLELHAERLTTSSQFKLFKEGFNHIFDPKLFDLGNLFTPQELRALFVCMEYDWRAFQESFGYGKGYTVDHRAVKMFWEVFQEELDDDAKRHFLMFFTGSDHVPPGGFREIGPRMWPLGDADKSKGVDPSEICPEVNTCHGYVVLHLPQYRSKEDLKERLLKALVIKTGFHKIPNQ